jgi:hypothetical protein
VREFPRFRRMTGASPMSKNSLQREGSDVAEMVASECSLQTLTRRSQADFEIDFFERILTRSPNNVDVLKALGILCSRKSWFRRGLQVYIRLAALRPHDPGVFYNLACSHAALGHTVDGLLALRHAFAAGFQDFELVTADPDLNPLRERPEFADILHAALVKLAAD